MGKVVRFLSCGAGTVGGAGNKQVYRLLSPVAVNVREEMQAGKLMEEDGCRGRAGEF